MTDTVDFLLALLRVGHCDAFLAMGNGDRAILFFYESTISQSMQRDDGNQDTTATAWYLDESERKVLDFNLTTDSQIYRILAAVQILRNERVFISGQGSFYKTIHAVVKSAFPEIGTKILLDFIDNADAETMVENKDDIPEFWFCNGAGKPYIVTDRRNVWCYERCLSDENRITQKDLYNPGPWPYEEVDYAAMNFDSLYETGPDVLETIEEDDEDGEW